MAGGITITPMHPQLRRPSGISPECLATFLIKVRAMHTSHHLSLAAAALVCSYIACAHPHLPATFPCVSLATA